MGCVEQAFRKIGCGKSSGVTENMPYLMDHHEEQNEASMDHDRRK